MWCCRDVAWTRDDGRVKPPAERPATLVGFGALCAALSFALAAVAVGTDDALPATSELVAGGAPVPGEGGAVARRGDAGASTTTPQPEPTSTTAVTTVPVPDGGGQPTTTVQPITTEGTAAPPPPPPAVAVAPLPPPTTTPEGTTPALSNRVFVFGDSVILGAATALPSALVGWDVVVDAAESRFEHEAPGILSARRGDIGRVVVILIGHNSGAGYDHETWIRRMMDELVGVERVVFLTAVEWGPGPAEFNRDLRRVAPEHPSIVVADWNALSRSNPGYTFDGLHLQAAGRQAMASLIAEAVGPVPA